MGTDVCSWTMRHAPSIGPKHMVARIQKLMG
jgi:hypothetical protein